MKQRQIPANYKTNQQMRVGVAAKVMLVTVIAAGFAACQTLTGMATNRDQNEPLGKQPTDAEQNLTTSQKQEVDGVRGQNSLVDYTVTDDVYSVHFSPDGQTLASGSKDNTIKLWQRDGTLITTFRGHTLLPVHSLSFSLDGQIIASSSSVITSDDPRTSKLWDLNQVTLRRKGERA